MSTLRHIDPMTTEELLDRLEKKTADLSRRYAAMKAANRAYAIRVRELEAEGMTRSDAQGVADAEDHMRRLNQLPLPLTSQEK